MKPRTAPNKDSAVAIRFSGQNPKHIVFATYQTVDRLHTRAVYEGISDLLQMSSPNEKEMKVKVKRQIRSLRSTMGLPMKPRAKGAYALALSWQKVGKNLEISMQKL